MINEKKCTSSIDKLAAEFDSNESTNFLYTHARTTKQIIKDIFDAVSFLKLEKENAKVNDNYGSSFALNALAIFAILMLIFSTSHKSDSELIEGLKLPSYIISIMLSSIWIGINIERTSVFKELWRFKTTKIILSLSFTGLVVCCTSEASAIINNIFNIDPSFFPFTRSFLTAYLFFKKISVLVYLLILVAAICVIHIFSYIKCKWNGESNVDFSFWPLSYIFFVLVFSYFSWGWVGKNFNEDVLSEKVYLLAHQLDFNNKNPCSNLKGSEVSVIFLGQNHDQVLVDYNTEKPASVSDFIEGNYFKGNLRGELKILKCLHE